MNNSVEYLGPELAIFEAATNWKAYSSGSILPYVSGRVLEVGAGIGSVTKTLCARLPVGAVESWTCLEPDQGQSAAIAADIASGDLPGYCSATAGTLSDLADGSTFETILYADVLEHIEDDRSELAAAAGRLSPGGRLVVLAPAHQNLFSELDRKANHYRRYTAKSLFALTPPDTGVIVSRYYDCVGMMASLANRLLLRRGVPSMGQIHVWDRLMVPVSRVLDPVFAHRLGKSVLVIWQKAGNV